MSDAVQRRPALGRVDPISAAIPERQPAAGAPPGETLNTPLNTRVRASTRSRLDLAVNKLRYEQNDRSISLASLTDKALDSFLRDLGI